MSSNSTAGVVRPTKKQRELLSFIQDFIQEHGYSPSFREIMNGLQYTSVATVALHVNNLIKRGHLRKRDRSARSLEVVADAHVTPLQSQVSDAEEKWLVQRVDHYFAKLESADKILAQELDELYVLLGALKVLGLEAAVRSFVPRLTELKLRTSSQEVAARG